jgi:hypothetical protein
VAATAGTTADAVAASFRNGRVWIMDEALSNRVSTIDVDKLLGTPAVSGGTVFVPWDRQSVSALDSVTGAELCRLVLDDEMVSYVFAVPEGVYYGSKGAFRLTSRSASGRRDSGTYVGVEWTDPEFPGEPDLWPDAFAGAGDARPSAKARARLAWYPAVATDDTSVRFSDDMLYFVYYRYVVGMKAADRTLLWVRGLDASVADVAAVPGGLFAVEESGALHFVRATDGGDAWSGDLGSPVARAGISVAGWIPPVGEPRGGDFRRQVLDALMDTDSAVVPVRKLIMALFGRISDPEVSRDLLQVLRTPEMPDDLRNAAAHALQLRPDGETYLEQSLETHYDYLNDTPVPPVGVIAGALRNMNARGAAPALVKHLLDPNTPLEAMELVVRAVVALGDDDVVEPLQKFLRMYAADSEFAGMPAVLEAAAVGIAAHGGDRGLRFLETFAAERFTPPALAASVKTMVDARRSSAQAFAALPRTVDDALFVRTITSNRTAYAQCLTDALRRRPTLAHVEVSFTVTGEGIVVDVSTTPADTALGLCLKPAVEQLALPRFQAQQDRFVVPLDLEQSPSAPAPAGD